jgi:hypothetical protein
MHLQEVRGLLQLYDDVCVRQSHFVGEHVGMRHGVLYRLFERMSVVFHIHHPICLHGDNFSIKFSFKKLLEI